MLKSNQYLQYRYSIRFHNRFPILQNNLTDNIDDKYQHFITSNKETAKEIIPRTSKQKKMKYSDDERVKQARSNVYTAYSCYVRSPTDERQEELNQKKRTSEDAYNITFCEELNHNITLSEQSNRTSKHQKSWKLINEITRRKTTKRSIPK